MNEIILKRRSIRKFTSRKIEKPLLEEIIKAGMYAPSAVNKQPWHFLVIDDHEAFSKIIEIHPNAYMLKTASHAILVCGDLHKQHADGFWLTDCGAATQNILLEAKSQGIGSCWIGMFPRKERMAVVKKLFQLPEHIEPFSLIALGYADEEKDTPDRFDPTKIFYNQWGTAF